MCPGWLSRERMVLNRFFHFSLSSKPHPLRMRPPV
jgi:hypothetical protein